MATKEISKNKKVVFDVILNIVASALPIAMLQFIIYPWVAVRLGDEDYGLMLTIYSVWIMVSNSLGIVLNNIKLLNYPKYNEMGIDGDIPILLTRWMSLNSIIIFVIIWLYLGEFNLWHLLLGVAVAGCILLKAYLEVGFRINLNYLLILLNNAILAVGFFLGFLAFRITGYWEFIFLVGYSASTIFCIFKTRLLKEERKKTPIYSLVKKDAYSLLLSAVITNMINYADKLVLYPLMGGAAVAIYYTATIIGKITGMLTGPINSVILSYITRWDQTKSNVFSKVLLIGFIIVSLGYGATLLVAKPVIALLFPQWLEEVMEIIPLTTITIMLNVLATILQPFVLKFCKMHWQIAISSIGSGVYFVSAIILWKFFGLKGFCVGTIVGVVVKLGVMIAVYYHSNSTQTVK